ncbi:hypothetical protein PGT21_020440 [Puccinia graminis f. sp. tritici]|uniref:CBM1 domain-containing protein n=1 Tax=Puccinia graminis f. sp. tritici TaxID=56615 RepID=A0A5B0RNW0_PUCGR|nr:hypothetical protein PGT21_020440 [Puccinia graminis f. sp. tritici]KAA1099048.1 hypothetical protein PGTUg99_000793 [Puccinia graminis f. sp. tritici]KAA1127666.1 hypothetical protein PGTUg99_004981 [Puccinia graminis f. sp. tritici]KAA1129751.1 hypothetical protein PGTUg99_036322 [Puccinia graminis f. sp. tritici]
MNVIKFALLAFVFGVSNVMSKNLKPCSGNTPAYACADDASRSPDPLIYIPPTDLDCSLTLSEIPWCCPQGAISSNHPSKLAYAQAHGCKKRETTSQ